MRLETLISTAQAVILGASSQKVGRRSAASTSDGAISPRETGRAGKGKVAIDAKRQQRHACTNNAHIYTDKTYVYIYSHSYIYISFYVVTFIVMIFLVMMFYSYILCHGMLWLYFYSYS